MDEVNTVVEQGYLNVTKSNRLDHLERLDIVNCKQISTVKDLYGTTHSISYEFNSWKDAWAKFKLDGKYDTFEANVFAAENTGRDVNMSVEIYVDDVLVGRLDNIVRDETTYPVIVSVNGEKFLCLSNQHEFEK